jgi:hypothetical protein
MKIGRLVVATMLLACGSAWAAPLATAGRSAIPKQVQQIISVDYRSLKASPTALALKGQVLPSNMKEFESALRDLGIDPDKDVETLTFVAFRNDKNQLRLIGIAQGPFPTKKVLKKFRLDKVRPVKYHTSFLYPASSGMRMVFLDDFTMLFGDDNALKDSLDARDGYAESLASNSEVTDLVNGADSGPVWSVLDQAGTQNLLHSALGDAASLADYNVVKKRLVGSRYSMDFTGGVTFDLDVTTSDAMTATTLSSLLKAGMWYKRFTATGPDKLAAESVSVDSQSDHLHVRFKANDNQFETLLKSDLFAAVSH